MMFLRHRINLVAALVVATLVFPGAQLIAAESGSQKAVLVTGASTGIGRNMAETMAAKGYFVDAAVQTVEQGGRGLHGLINNAGVYVGGPMVDVDVEEFKWLMDVNVYGVYLMTQAFAPMIIESKGRISTVGSIAGILSGRFSGLYSMSKHAVEAYTDSLAAEMEPLGVHVSVIEPGNYDSAISVSARSRILAKIDGYQKEGSPFAEQFREWTSQAWDRSHYKQPDEVSAALASQHSCH